MSYISVSEAAERVGVTPQTVRNWISWGAIPGYEFYRNPRSGRAGLILIEESDLDGVLGVIQRKISRNEDDEVFLFNA